MKSITFIDDDLARKLDVEMLWSILCYNEKMNQPNVYHNGGYYVIDPKLHEWFASNHIVYSLSFVDLCAKDSTITFQKDSDAVLFKLTWM
jgi:hypothetical protein